MGDVIVFTGRGGRAEVPSVVQAQILALAGDDGDVLYHRYLGPGDALNQLYRSDYRFESVVFLDHDNPEQIIQSAKLSRANLGVYVLEQSQIVSMRIFEDHIRNVRLPTDRIIRIRNIKRHNFKLDEFLEGLGLAIGRLLLWSPIVHYEEVKKAFSDSEIIVANTQIDEGFETMTSPVFKFQLSKLQASQERFPDFSVPVAFFKGEIPEELFFDCIRLALPICVFDQKSGEYHFSAGFEWDR